MKSVNLVVLEWDNNREDNECQRLVRIENGDTGERILDFVGFIDERESLLTAIERVKTKGKSHYAMQDLGFILSLSMYKIDDELYVGGQIMKHHHVMDSHLNYKTVDSGLEGNLQAYRVTYLISGEEKVVPKLNIIFE